MTRPPPSSLAARNVLTPEALAMIDAIERTGSFAAAARELGKVPSALTYNVRQLEDALDALLFDRRSRQASLTSAGRELLVEGRRLLNQMDAVANRVKRVATGWETQLTLAVDGVISERTVLELCDAFFALDPAGEHAPDRAAATPLHMGRNAQGRGPGTRIRLRTEVLAGTWEALLTGQADLAIGVAPPADGLLSTDVTVFPLGELPFVFAVAPHHPLAAATAPISENDLLPYRAVAVADSAHRHAPLTVNLLAGQDVMTVATLGLKVQAQLRGSGCGFLPEPVIRGHVAAGRLIVKATERVSAPAPISYAFRSTGGGTAGSGLALRWWLAQLESPATRTALLEQHGPDGFD